MAYVLTECPNCRQRTPFDDSRLQCYCINCGYQIRRDSVDLAGGIGLDVPDAKAADDGLFEIALESRERKIGYTVLLDGEQVLRTVGGHDTIRVTPGKHVLKVVSDMQTASVELDMDADIRLSIVTGFGGMKIKRV